jgi:hypothetical protein
MLRPKGYIYVLRTDGCILRVLASLLASDRACSWERLDLPRLLSFIPIVSQKSEVHGFYGVNCNGRILRFAADLTRYFGLILSLLIEKGKRTIF